MPRLTKLRRSLLSTSVFKDEHLPFTRLCCQTMENHANASASGTSDSKDPSAFLSEIIGVPVTVKLNSGTVYKGAPLSLFTINEADEG